MVSTNKVWSGVTDYFSGKCSQSDLQASPPQQVHSIEYEYDDADDGGEDVHHDNADKTWTIIIMMTTIIRRSKFVRDGGSDEWVGYVGHHDQGQGDPDGSQRRAEGHHHRHHHYHQHHHDHPLFYISHHHQWYSTKSAWLIGWLMTCGVSAVQHFFDSWFEFWCRVLSNFVFSANAAFQFHVQTRWFTSFPLSN